MTEQEFALLSPEEQDAVIAELEDSINFSQASTDEIVADEIKDEHKKEITSSNLEAASRAAAHGFTGGYSDEVQASISAISDTIKLTNEAVQRQGMSGFDNVLSTYSEQWHKNHQIYNEELKQLEKDHPDLFSVAEIGGSIAGSALTASIFPSSIVGQLAGMASYGFLHGSGKSEAHTLDGRLKAGLSGAGTEAAIGGAIGGVGKVGRLAVKKAATHFGPSQLINYLSPSLKKFRQTFGIKEDTFEYANRMVNYTMDVERYGSKKTINVLQGAHTAEESLDYVAKASKQTNVELSKMYGRVDRVAPLEAEAVEDISNVLMGDVLDGITTVGKDEVADQTYVRLREQLRKRFDNDLFMNDPNGATLKLANGAEVPLRVPKRASISRLNEMKNQYYQQAKTAGKTSEFKSLELGPHYEKAAKILDEFIDNHIHKNSDILSEAIPVQTKQIGEAAEQLSESFYDMWKATKTKSRDLMHTERLLNDRLTNPTNLDLFRDSFKNHINKISIGAAAATMVLGAPVSVTGAVVGGIYTLAKLPQLQKAAGIGLTKLASTIEKNPDKYSKLAMRLMAAADVSSDAFYERILEAGAEVDLSESKLQRNFDDVMSRQDSLITLARTYDPSIAKALRDAINSGNSQAVGTILTSSPKMSRFISSGLGWEGRALSPQDQQAVADYIKGLKPADRRKASLDFQKNQMIPSRMLTGENPKAAEIQVLYELGKKRANQSSFSNINSNEDDNDIPLGVRSPEL